MSQTDTTHLAAPPIAAVVYPADAYPHDLFRSVVDILRDGGHHVAGLIQHDRPVPGRRKCDMDLEDLATGLIVPISEYRGEASAGCRLDVAALLSAGGVAGSAIAATRRPALMVINKFGKLEAEGGGLIPLIVASLDDGVPLLVGVPERNWAAWTEFAGDMADTLPPEPGDVLAWLRKAVPDFAPRAAAAAQTR
jgi:hypothetical protein